MARYSVEHREWVLRQMMPPLNRTVADLAEETGINQVTLYAWRKQAIRQRPAQYCEMVFGRRGALIGAYQLELIGVEQ